ncbi:MAG: hypothetical protein U0414_10535 [Polyangiaceae bacterium]
MIRSKFAVAVAIVSFCALPLVACSGGGDSGPSVSKQCESLMNANEAGTKKIEAIKDDDATASAKAFQEFAAEVDKLGIKDPELKKLADEYSALLKSAATTQTSLAALMKKVDAPAASAKAMKSLEKEMDALEKQVDSYVKNEDQLADKITAYCKDK